MAQMGSINVNVNIDGNPVTTTEWWREHDAKRLQEIVRDTAQRSRLMAKLAEALSEQDGDAVLFFRKAFGGQIYTYAAVQYTDRSTRLKWSTTGPSSPKDLSTSSFVEWLANGDGVEELWWATTWEQVV